MKKINKPTISHVEILARAYMSYEAEVRDWKERCDAAGMDNASFEHATESFREKMEAIAVMYKLETGVDIR